MALNFAKLKKVNPEYINAVFGYFREAHRELLPQDNPYYDMHPLIIYTCLAYYHIKYEWDTDNLSDECIVDGDCISKSTQCNASSFLRGEITNGVHK